MECDEDSLNILHMATIHMEENHISIFTMEKDHDNSTNVC